jgi:5,5'-dehydrodivanillate O-demethylase oxygenase subunit
MLRQEENERLTRVGPGTPMGALLRRYWQPIATTGELAENPVRAIRILGEDLTLYRDRGGRLGLIDQRCAHRRVDLRCGIPVVDGLECPYHGWTYDATGQCIAQPAESSESSFKERVKLLSYRVEELGGLIWAYLGPRPAPLIPRWAPLVEENAYRQIGVTEIPCNWLQCQENSMDSVHAEYLHGHLWEYVLERLQIDDPAKIQQMRRMSSHHVKLRFEPFQFGFRKYRLLEGEDERTSGGWNVGNPLVFPYFVLIGSPGRYEMQIRIAHDDTHTRHYSYQVFMPGPGVKVPRQDAVPTFDAPMEDLPDWVLGQDVIAWPLQGDIVDRSQERLAESDKGLILFRRFLQEQMDLVEDGGEPINVFRDAARNQRLELPIQNYGGAESYRKGSLPLMTTGSNSPYLDEIEKLMLQGAAALAEVPAAVS